MRSLLLSVLVVVGIAGPALAPLPVRAQSAANALASGSTDMHWSEGASNCKTSPHSSLEVHYYNAQTFILRESLCVTFEAPFMYLLVGSTRAMLIDTGDVADADHMPLATTVMGLLPSNGSAKLPLLVVHTHRHLDHREGDGQFAQLPGVQVVGFDLDSVKRFYNFTDWPNGQAQIDLGDRIVDVIPTPGHNETHVSFYDRKTGLFFSGDFLMPARLLIDDAAADLQSARRVAAFVKDRPVTAVLGGHVELDARGETYAWESTYHPNEHALPMTKDDLLALPAAVASFNGFYAQSGPFLMMNSMRVLIAIGIAVVVVLIALVIALIRYVRRRLRTRRAIVSN
ncbi:MBL fold metallo-hydrolase [Granulicella sp. L60]|uniref:MBL fold metallo-hydrolase n=1 Tax=Granulicella sp. L60 TaxID=1641866 RepID=UPI00131CFC05|nr:MBL fold metallo-hydrolase [Granulicella sp. L60]